MLPFARQLVGKLKDSLKVSPKHRKETKEFKLFFLLFCLFWGVVVMLEVLTAFSIPLLFQLIKGHSYCDTSHAIFLKKRKPTHVSKRTTKAF